MCGRYRIGEATAEALKRIPVDSSAEETTEETEIGKGDVYPAMCAPVIVGVHGRLESAAGTEARTAPADRTVSANRTAPADREAPWDRTASVDRTVSADRATPALRPLPASAEGSYTGYRRTVMRWGFSGYEGKGLLINARAESAAEKRTFRDCVLYRRCVIPAGGFYEWDREKQKYTFTRRDGALLYMAGIYRREAENEPPRYVILTTAANASMQPVHDRMPLILEEHEIEAWLYDEKRISELLAKRPPLLQAETAYEQMRLDI